MKRFVVAMDGSTGTKVYLRSLVTKKTKGKAKEAGDQFTNERSDSLRFPTEKSAKGAVEKLKKSVKGSVEKSSSYVVEPYEEGM